MNGPTQVSARLAMVEGRLAGLRARTGSRGGGGRVGSGMEVALAAAQARLDGGSGATSVTSPSTPSADRATTLGGLVSPSTPAGPAPGGTAGTWSRGLPADGAPWAPAVEQAARRHGVPPALLGAVVWTESGFDPGVVSPAGAIGLGQLMPATAAELGVDPTDPEQNLDGAARYLRQQLDAFGDTRLALAAYNAGPGRVRDAGGVPAIPETTQYVARVTERAALLGGPA